MMRMGRPGLLGTMARTAVIAGTATEVAGEVANHNQQRMMQQQAMQQQPVQQQAPAQAPAVDESSIIDQLKELAALKEQGILTDEEFAAQKAKLLGS